MKLLTGAATGVTGTAIDLTKGVLGRTKNNEFTCYIWGTFAGGTAVTLELSPDDGTTWIAHPDVDGLLAASAVSIKIRATQVRGDVNSGAADSIDMALI